MSKYEFCGLLKPPSNAILWSSKYFMAQTRVQTTETSLNLLQVAAAFSQNAFVEALDLMASHQSVVSSALQTEL